MAKKKVETADKTPVVEKKNKYPRWTPIDQRMYICPNCGHQTTEPVLQFLKHCPVCGESAE